MPGVVEFVCQRCGTVTHAPAAERPNSIARCECGGWRQVVRFFTERRLTSLPVERERRKRRI
jgi:hypothetical protein